MKQLGRNGPIVSTLGLGCQGLSRQAGSYETDRDEAAIATIQAAIEAGVTFINTADFYGRGHNEMVIGRAIKGRRDKVFLSVKFGALVAPSGRMIGLDARPNSVKNFASYSLQRLGVDVIDLYQPGRADPDVPYEETIGAVAELIKEGKVRYLGVSEVGADLLRRANAVHPVTALEIEYSLAFRLIEADILPTARQLGVGVVAYRVLADGLLTGALSPETPPTGGHFIPPRLAGENLRRNVATASRLNRLAADKGFTPAQLAIAWVLSQGDDVLPLVGISRSARVAEALRALDVQFTDNELSELNRTFAPGAIVGDRYPSFAMKWAAS
jgi:aryl-alcohol dehydrogenase-like predicted oxidoreductase